MSHSNQVRAAAMPAGWPPDNRIKVIFGREILMKASPLDCGRTKFGRKIKKMRREEVY